MHVGAYIGSAAFTQVLLLFYVVSYVARPRDMSTLYKKRKFQFINREKQLPVKENRQAKTRKLSIPDQGEVLKEYGISAWNC